MNLNRRSLCTLAALLTLPGAALAQTGGNSSPLKFGVGMFQPDREKNDATYRPRAAHLAQRLGRPVELRTVDSW
ncbi:MAG: phosphate/phosphite/phosphonate ABC transporter substrate-binding protein, partial [Chitinophagaceae bacterium]|nr:phosphate/phosphite/phosphonate ABC transporter substrate-binding protein [Rubrivivax sp.]